jgi:hypothetical protein
MCGIRLQAMACSSDRSDLARKARLDFIRENKKQCHDCGGMFPHFVLDYDHARGTKVNTVAKVARSYGWKKLLAEIEKCDVVCANCHKIRTRTRLA